jgi:transcriptional regulator with XRE-family HTH domain
MESKFGRRLESARKAKHLTRSELSKQVGVSESILRDMEIRNSASRNIYDLLPKIATVLETSMTFLLTGREPAKVDRIIRHVDAIVSNAEEVAKLARD